MKKPDAVTEITRENFKEKVWPLDISEMIGIGSATQKKLRYVGIHTLGQLAQYPAHILESRLGKAGAVLSRFANGLDTAPVRSENDTVPVKSVGHGSTAKEDLTTEQDVWRFMLGLSLDLGVRLREYDKFAYGVSIHLRDNNLFWKQYQHQFSYPTQSAMTIAAEAFRLFEQKHLWTAPLRSVTVTAICLTDAGEPVQMDLFHDLRQEQKKSTLEETVHVLKKRFGKQAILPATLLGDNKLPPTPAVQMTMPTATFLA